MSDTEYLLFNGILVYSQHKQQLASTVLSVAGKYAYPYLSQIMLPCHALQMLRD